MAIKTEKLCVLFFYYFPKKEYRLLLVKWNDYVINKYLSALYVFSGVMIRKKKELRINLNSFFVIRLGFEPRTPTLKVLCSTS